VPLAECPPRPGLEGTEVGRHPPTEASPGGPRTSAISLVKRGAARARPPGRRHDTAAPCLQKNRAETGGAAAWLHHREGDTSADDCQWTKRRTARPGIPRGFYPQSQGRFLFANPPTAAPRPAISLSARHQHDRPELSAEHVAGPPSAKGDTHGKKTRGGLSGHATGIADGAVSAYGEN